MTERRITRVTLFVPGKPTLREAKLDPGIDSEWIENDGQFGRAFSFGTVPPERVSAIDAAPGALVLHFKVDLREGRKEIVGVVERLREAGALAVRLEQSKLGWEVARWLELFGSDDPWDWHRAAVMFLGDETLQSCGMHAFSLPDVRVATDGDAPGLQHLASVLNVYQLAEDPVLLTGHTFSPDRETPRRVVERWPDTGYAPDHPCHNPYGVWRLGPAGGKGRPPGRVVSVFAPALHVLLQVMEQKQGKPLTRQQVESIRDDGACITMEPRHAQELERSRGYADLEPELVWEQWQAVRKQG